MSASKIDAPAPFLPVPVAGGFQPLGAPNLTLTFWILHLIPVGVRFRRCFGGQIPASGFV
jgi:hypothetical protein